MMSIAMETSSRTGMAKRISSPGGYGSYCQKFSGNVHYPGRAPRAPIPRTREDQRGVKGVFMKGQKDDIPYTDHRLNLLCHELGNVLNGLLGMAELLGESGLDIRQERLLRAIEQSGRQMQSLVNSYSHAFRSGAPQFRPCMNRVDGVELLEQVIISHLPAANAKQNRLLLVTDSEMPRHWYCDSCLVRQILDNLVGNAVKFTAGGEIVVEAAAAPEIGDTLLFRVSDNGPGMDEETASRVFEPYQRGNGQHGDGPGNLGLGLYLAQRIVRAMKGRISCSSGRSGGSCFEITLPGALMVSEVSPPVLRSALLARIFVILDLEHALGRSVRGFLGRLGVRSSNVRASAMNPDGRRLVVVISEANSDADFPARLLLAPADPSLDRRVLESPVLESSLGLLLLELALEWRGLQFRNGKPG